MKPKRCWWRKKIWKQNYFFSAGENMVTWNRELDAMTFCDLGKMWPMTFCKIWHNVTLMRCKVNKYIPGIYNLLANHGIIIFCFSYPVFGRTSVFRRFIQRVPAVKEIEKGILSCYKSSYLRELFPKLCLFLIFFIKL